LAALEQATRLTLLTGSLTAPARKQALLDAAAGRGDRGRTHALIQDKVQFADLGLVVVDEQTGSVWSSGTRCGPGLAPVRMCW